MPSHAQPHHSHEASEANKAITTAPQMAPTLLSLPNEVLIQIGKALHPAALGRFAQASRHTHAVAKVQLFHTISFHVTTPELLAQHVRECEAYLRRHSDQDDECFRHVRRVVVTGVMKPPRGNSTRLSLIWLEELATINVDHQYKWQLSPPPAPLDWDTNVTTLHDVRPLPTQRDWVFMKALSEAAESDSFWEPLANLVHQFPGLKDLEFNCSNRVPPLLLRTLEQQRPTPRLHAGWCFAYRYRTLSEERILSLPVLRTEDLDLFRSKCLFRLSVGPLLEYADDMLDLVSTLAPNLKEICFNKPVRDPSETDDAGERPSASIEDLIPADYTPPARNRGDPSRASITRLEVCPRGDKYFRDRDKIITPRTLRSLTLSMHSESLRVLRLDMPIGWDALGALVDTALPALSHLMLNLLLPGRFGDHPGSAEDYRGYLKMTKQLLKELPQLSTLELQNWDHKAEPLHSALPANLDTLLLRRSREHPIAISSSLIHISLISIEEIIRISQACPKIQDLALHLQRTMGNAAEVAQYRAIGRFTQLRRLTLTLVVEPNLDQRKEYSTADYPFSQHQHLSQSLKGSGATFLNSPLESTAEAGRYSKRGHVVELMINCALDQELAGSIFRTIRRSNARFRQEAHDNTAGGGGGGSSLPTLQQILVKTCGGDDPLVNMAWQFYSVLCGAYMVNTDPAGVVPRLDGAQPVRSVVGRSLAISRLSEILGKIWPTTWSHMYRTGWGWSLARVTVEWSSLPLELDDADTKEAMMESDDDLKLDIRIVGRSVYSSLWNGSI